MPKGPNRQALDRYLDSAQEGILKGAGDDWKSKADALKILARAMKVGAEQAELRIGEQTLTGPALRKSMEDSAASIETKAAQLLAAGQALDVVSTDLEETRLARDTMPDLGAKPDSLPPMKTTPGIPATPEEIQAHSASAAARQGERD